MYVWLKIDFLWNSRIGRLCLALLLSVLLPLCAFSQTGPLLTDEDLFDSINLSYPGLEQVSNSVQQLDYPAAITNLADYLRERTNVTWYFDPHNLSNSVSYSSSTATATSTGTITIIRIPYSFPDGDIDWFFNVTTNPASGYAPNNEWLWQLNRMYWWPNLGNAFRGAGNDEYYAQAWVEQFRDWVASCPAQSSRANYAGSTWRTIETGLRMSDYWPNTYHRMLHASSFTENDFALYLKTCIEQARYLRQFYTKANFLTMEMSGLYTVGGLFPELNEAAEWRDFAATTLRDEQSIQFVPDGWHIELAPGYHIVAIDNILRIYELATLEGIDDELPADYLDGLEKAWQALMYMTLPDRVAPPVNDAGRSKTQDRLLEAYSLVTNRLDFLWLATDGEQGVPPEYVSYSFPYGGFNFMRSDWERDANCAVFDAGPLGSSGHRHEDKLALQLWCYGREILFDHGAGEYEQSIWRTYSMSSYGHNTVVVDGLQQRGGDGNSTPPDDDYVSTSPIDMRWESDINHDFAAGIYNRGYDSYNNRPAEHVRRVLFVKPDLYLVADTLNPSDGDSHTYQARWNLLPVETEMDSVTKAVTTIDPDLPNLSVVPCLVDGLTVDNVVTGNTSSLPDILGWKVQKGTPSHVPCTTVTHTRSGSGVQQFLTLMMPLKEGESNSVVAVTSTGDTSADLLLNDGRTLQLFADPDPERGLTLVELMPDGTTNRLCGAGFVPPSITDPGDQVMRRDSTYAIELTLSDADGSADDLRLDIASTNSVLFPSGSIQVSGSGAVRTLTFTSAPGLTGEDHIVITVIDPDGSTTSVDFRLIVDAPPYYTGVVPESDEEVPVDIDLRTITADDVTISSLLFFTDQISSEDGTVELLPDGYTLRFTPASNLTGRLNFSYMALDRSPDPRLLLAYDFEEEITNSSVYDYSGHGRDGTLDSIGSGIYEVSSEIPAVFKSSNLSSLNLVGNSDDNCARLRCSVATNDLNFSDHDWTFSGWFNRRDNSDDDFIFYIGRGDGFGAQDELHLQGKRNANALQLYHYIGEAAYDINMEVGNIETGVWYHVALVFERLAERSGVMSLYVGGALRSVDSNLLFNLDQSVPITFGGNHSTTYQTKRWFNGHLDELAVFDEALSTNDIAMLASRSVGHFGGQEAALNVEVYVWDTNDPLITVPGRQLTMVDNAVSIDLRTLVSDVETPESGWIFDVTGSANGTAELQPDGYTVRFTPQPTGFSGEGGLDFSVSDTGMPDDLLLYYDYEYVLPNGVGDLSRNYLDAYAVTVGTGEWYTVSDVPHASAVDSSSSVSLLENAETNVASLKCDIPVETFNFNDHDWTFSTWVKRASSSTDDFFFYFGKGDGYGANEELQLYGGGGGDTLRLRHYIGEANTDVSFIASGFSVGVWHHVALTYSRTGENRGAMALYLDGVLKASDSDAYMNLDQSVPVVFGGHYSETSRPFRWFNGYLDDTAIFTRALSSEEITRLASGSLIRFGGSIIQGNVTVCVFAQEDRPLISSSAMQGGDMNLTVDGPSGFGYTVEASTNLNTWVPVQDFENPALPFLWADPDSPLHPQRFYRIRLTP